MTAVRRILCPIDWSEPAGLALEAASRIVRNSNVELIVLHVLEAGWRGVPERLPQSAAETQYETERSLRTLTVEMGLSRLQVHSLVKWGDPATQICDVARKTAADAIVLSTHGNSGWKRWRLGNVSQRVCDTAPCPVLVIGPTAGHYCAGGIEYPFRRIVSAANGSWVALNAAAGLASQCEAELFCICPQAEGELDRSRDAVQQWAMHSPHEVHLRQVEAYGEIGTSVLNVANQHFADLIVLDNSERRRTGNRATVSGIIQHARCPVWLQPPTLHDRFEDHWQTFRSAGTEERSLLSAV